MKVDRDLLDQMGDAYAANVRIWLSSEDPWWPLEYALSMFVSCLGAEDDAETLSLMRNLERNLEISTILLQNGKRGAELTQEQYDGAHAYAPILSALELFGDLMGRRPKGTPPASPVESLAMGLMAVKTLRVLAVSGDEIDSLAIIYAACGMYVAADVVLLNSVDEAISFRPLREFDGV